MEIKEGKQEVPLDPEWIQLNLDPKMRVLTTLVVTRSVAELCSNNLGFAEASALLYRLLMSYYVRVLVSSGQPVGGLTGQQFWFWYYSRNGLLIGLKILVTRHSHQLGQHDQLSILKVSYSAGCVSGVQVGAYFKKGALTFAANPAMKPASGTPAELEYEPRTISLYEVEGGSDVSNPYAPQGFKILAPNVHLVPPNETPRGLLNLNLLIPENGNPNASDLVKSFFRKLLGRLD